MKRKLNEILMNQNSDEKMVVSTGHSVLEVAKILAQKKIESILVVEYERVVGIVTEKDIFNALNRFDIYELKFVSVESIMSKKVICVDPSYSLEECLFIMCKLNIHHLPVLDLQGINIQTTVSLKQIAKILMDEKQFEINQLIKYITGNDPKVHGENSFRNHLEIAL